jgi:capsular polysaccharide biosynthesis protein
VTLLQAEPTFIDLLLTLMRHKAIIIICTAIGACIGGMAAIMVPRTYAYTTTLEIGRVQEGAAMAGIEVPEAVIAKVTNAFLPAIERAHGDARGESGFTLGLEVKNPRGTNLVIITSKAATDRQEEHLTLHRKVADRVLAEHQSEFKLLRTNMELELDQARRAAAGFKDQEATLALRRTLLQEKRALASKRITEIDNELASKTESRTTAGRSLTGQDQVLTLMMLDIEITRERDKRDDVQRELALGLVEETHRLSRDEADLLRIRQDQEDRITAIQARIANVAETRLIGEPQRSQKPVGLGKTMQGIIGVFLGFGLGVIAAFFRQAMQNNAARPSAEAVSV